MRYTTFILKRLYKNKFHYIPFVFISILIVVMYVAENNNTWHFLDDPYFSGQESIERLEEQTASFREVMKDETASIEKREQAKSMIAPIEQELSYLKERQSAAEQEDWITYYTIDIELQKLGRERALQDVERYGWNQAEATRPIDRSIAYDQHMIAYDLGYDGISPGSQGFSFINYVYRFFMPMILTLLLVYLTSRIFCFSYVEEMDIQKLLPMSIVKKQSSRLLASFVIGVSIVLFFTLLLIGCGTIGNAMGSLYSPVEMYSSLGEDHYVTLISILPQLLIICVLSICFIANAVAIISQFIHKTMACLFVALVIMMGGLLILPSIVPLHEYLHLFPTTYLDFFNVITGELAYSVNNSSVTAANGMIVLCIGNLILILFHYVLQLYKDKGVKQS